MKHWPLVLALLFLLPSAQSHAAEVRLDWRKAESVDPQNYAPNRCLPALNGDVYLLSYVTATDGSPALEIAKHQGSSGNILWKQYSNIMYARMAVDAFGALIIAGSSPNKSADYSISIAKYRGSSGSLLWRKYDAIENRDIYCADLAVDSENNIILVGSVQGSRSNNTFIAKYATDNGAQFWRSEFGEGYDHCIGAGAAIDSYNNIYVTGEAFQKGSISHMAITSKFLGSNGLKRWESIYSDPTHNTDYGQFVVVDKSDNLFVGGGFITASDGYSIYFTKYHPGNGEQKWVTVKSPSGGSPDFLSDLTIDARGDLIFAGATSVDILNDMYVGKLAGTSGATIWENVIDGPLGENDYGNFVAVNANSDVYLLGTAQENDRHNTYFAKFRSTDGETILEKYLIPSPGNYYYNTSLAVDGYGSIFATGYSYNITPASIGVLYKLSDE